MEEIKLASQPLFPSRTDLPTSFKSSAASRFWPENESIYLFIPTLNSGTRCSCCFRMTCPLAPGQTAKILCNWPKASPWILDFSHSCFYVSLRFHLGEAITLHRVFTFLLVNGAKYPLLLLTDFNTSEWSKMRCSAYIQHHVACDHWLFHWGSRSKQNENSIGQLSSSEWWNESLGQVTDKNVRKTKALFAEPDLTAA